MKPIFLNYIGFQAGWLACVVGAGRGALAAGPAAAVVLLGAHLAFSGDRSRETRRIVAVALFGLLTEAAALSFGRHDFSGAAHLPLWVVALWLLLAATLESSFAWLSGRPVLAAALGAIAGPLSFRAGVVLGAGSYVAEPAQAAVVLAAQWAFALPAAFVVSRRIR